MVLASGMYALVEKSKITSVDNVGQNRIDYERGKKYTMRRRHFIQV